MICGLQGRWFLKDGTAVADILDSVVLWDGGGATLLQQTGPSTICIQAPLGDGHQESSIHFSTILETMF